MQSRWDIAGAGENRRGRHPLSEGPGRAADYAPIHNNIGVSLARCGHVDEAIEQYQRALEIKPDYGEVYNNLGAAFLGRGQVEEAMADFRKAVENAPDCADAHNNLAVLLLNRGRLDEAIDHYRQALNIQPDHPDARAASSRLCNCGEESTRPSPACSRRWTFGPTT